MSRLYLFLDEDARLASWTALDAEAGLATGTAADELPDDRADVWLVAPGQQVTTHWLDLPESLTPAQAAAAARLRLTEMSAEPVEALHVAVGPREADRLAVTAVSREVIERWLTAASSLGIEVQAVVPAPFLLDPPEEGVACHRREGSADYRGLACAFSAEPGIAEAILGTAPADTLDRPAFTTSLREIAKAPPINLLQGEFAAASARWAPGADWKRLGALAILLGLLSLAVQVAILVAFTFAADRLEQEAAAFAEQRSRTVPFSTATSSLFAAVGATPDVELASLDYDPARGLRAAVAFSHEAALQPLTAQLEARGFFVRSGGPRTVGGRNLVDLEVTGR